MRNDPFAITLRDGGGTFRVGPGDSIVLDNPDWGYTVGRTRGSGVTIQPHPTSVFLPVTLLFRAMRYVAVAYSVGLVGTWYDGGIIYVDPVVIMADRREALRLGRSLNQRAIYDNVNQRVISIRFWMGRR